MTASAVQPHPLDPLSTAETDRSRQVILDACDPDVAIKFRSIFLEEPPKAELLSFLEIEHSGKLTADTTRPKRVAKVQYDTIRGDKAHEYVESWVDVLGGVELRRRPVDKIHQAGIITYVEKETTDCTHTMKLPLKF
jgi:primary-amine oxidase